MNLHSENRGDTACVRQRKNRCVPQAEAQHRLRAESKKTFSSKKMKT